MIILKPIPDVERREDSFTYTWSELAHMLGVKSPEDNAERVWNNVVNGDYSWVREEVWRELGDDATKEEVDERCMELEQESIDRECNEYDSRYRGAIRTVAENLFMEHLLSLTEVEEEGKESHFVVEPMKGEITGWYRAASKIIDTINGVGRFHFSTVRELMESCPYATLRDAVLLHAHWIPYYLEVYEGTKARSLVDARMR